MATAKTTGRRRDSTETRQRLFDATRTLLLSRGFAAATTRAIATEAECNQGLISYHFGGLNPLLLEVLDASMDARLAAYHEALEEVRGIKSMRAVAARLYREDRETGHVRILAELVAGGLMDRDLGREVAQRVQPWADVAEMAVAKVIPTNVIRKRFPVREAAYGIVALFIGLEMLGSLTGDHDRSQRVIDRLASRLLSQPT